MPDHASRFSLQGKKVWLRAHRGASAQRSRPFSPTPELDVGIVGRDAEGLETTRDAIAATGRRCVVIQADLRTVDGPRTAAPAASSSWERWTSGNNAGVFHREGLLETTVEHREETLAVNLRAPFLLAQVVARGMIERRRGKIVNISSLAARVGCEGHAAYSSSKGGLDMLTRVMAAEWGPFNIQTNSVAPTVVLTDMGKRAWSDEEKSAPVKARIPLHRFGLPLEIADLALFLASPASDFICGQVVFIDGGYSAV